MNKPTTPGLESRLFISILPALTGLWIPFLHIYLLNAANLTLPFTVHLPLLGLLSAAVAGISFVIQTFIPSRFRLGVSSVLLFIGIFFWAEGTLFIGDFGFLQGGDMDWGKNQHLLYFELMLAVILGFLAFRFKEKFTSYAGTITLVILVSSLANIYPAFQADQSRTKSHAKHTFTQEGVMQLSPEKNVLLFIIDTFQSDVFAEIIVDNPEWKDFLDGFTYFPNATSAFPKTYASIPNILTGQAFDNSQPFPSYLENAYLGNSAPKVLKDNGFDVRYKSFTWQPYFADPKVADNLSAISSTSGRHWMQTHEFTQLSNLALFRLAPFLAKPWIYNDNEFRINDPDEPQDPASQEQQLSQEQCTYSQGNKAHDLKFHDEMMAFLSAGSNKPTFRVFHFLGVHEPLNLDQNLAFIGKQANNRKAFRNQAEGMLKMLAMEFDRLREIGAFDNSLIFVVGDHGCGEYAGVGFNPEFAHTLGLDLEFSKGGEPVKQDIQRSGIPLILAKKINNKGPMKISKSPVELGDFPNTVFHELGFEKSANGPSVFEVPETSDRIRYHKHYQFSGWGQDYIVPLTEYAISGFSWDPTLWRPTGRDLNQEAIDSLDGEMVVLGLEGNLDYFDNEGWTAPDSQGRSISGKTASINIPISKHSGSALLEVRTKPYLHSTTPEPMTIFINDEILGVWDISHWSPIKLESLIPSRIINGRSDLNIRFEMEEVQNTGPFIIEVRVDYAPEIPAYSLGDSIIFLPGENSTEYTSSGWAPPESWGTWTLGNHSRILLALESIPKVPIEAEIVLRPAFFKGAPPLNVDVIANGITVSTWLLDSEGWQTKSFTIDESLFGESKNLEIFLSIRNPRAPNDYTTSNDSRMLGMGFKELVIKDPTGTSKEIPSTFRKNLILNDVAGVKTKGLHKLENWQGIPVAWTSGTAGFKLNVPKTQKPNGLVVEVLSTSPAGSTITIDINGLRVLPKQQIKGKWTTVVDLSNLPKSEKMEITLTSNTFIPAEFNAGSKDLRSLGVALSKMILVE